MQLKHLIHRLGKIQIWLAEFVFLHVLTSLASETAAIILTVFDEIQAWHTVVICNCERKLDTMGMTQVGASNLNKLTSPLPTVLKVSVLDLVSYT